MGTKWWDPPNIFFFMLCFVFFKFIFNFLIFLFYFILFFVINKDRLNEYSVKKSKKGKEKLYTKGVG